MLAIVGWIASRRSGARTGRVNALALVASLLFAAYLGNQVATASRVPAIHDAATDLDDLPRFTALTVRPDNLARIPDNGRPELAAMDPESRWKAMRRELYADLRTLRVAASPAAVVRRAEALARSRPGRPARRGRGGDRDNLVLPLQGPCRRARLARSGPARRGGSVVDMRSISRMSGSDVGVNAACIRGFLADLGKG